MTMRDLPSNVLFSRPSKAVAAATTEVDGTGVDMSNYRRVVFLFLFGAVVTAAALTVRTQMSTDDGSTDAYASNAMLGTTVSVPDDNANAYGQIAWIEIVDPQKRYVRPVVAPGNASQNFTLDGILALRYEKQGSLPVTQPTNTVVSGSKIVLYPAVGTP